MDHSAPDVAAWRSRYDLASKREGWLITSDSRQCYVIARLDDTTAWIEDGWLLDYKEPKFVSDEAALAFVRQRALAGSSWHAKALKIHGAQIAPATTSEAPGDAGSLAAEILANCSAGPWQHGLELPAFSADSRPCVYSNERSLAALDEENDTARANAVLLAAAYELCQELGQLISVLFASGLAELSAEVVLTARRQAKRGLALLSRIHQDLRKTASQRHGQEEAP
jgi:hypothetical protein